MSGTIVTTCTTKTEDVIDRLRPDKTVAEETHMAWPAISWPFLPKGDVPSNVKKITKPTFLRRSTSLDRLRQFPNYLCNRTSVLSSGSILALLGVLQAIVTLLRTCLLAIAVYAGVFMVCLQLGALFVALAYAGTPPGLLFMLGSLALLSAIAIKTIHHDKHHVR